MKIKIKFTVEVSSATLRALYWSTFDNQGVFTPKGARLLLNTIAQTDMEELLEAAMADYAKRSAGK